MCTWAGASSPAAAADREFASRFTANDTGQITLIANTLLTCPNPDTNAGCAAAQAGTATGTALNNNEHAMVRVDADDDTDTFTSSSADLNLPAGATVLFAGLYWSSDTSAGTGGEAAPTPTARDQVKLRAPGGAYQTITADGLDASTAQSSRYQGFTDVTDRVRAGGEGTYWVADVQSGTGEDRHAGWSLVIAYRDPSAPPRNLSIFDGFQTVNQTNDEITIEVSGFLTPPSGPVRTRLGVVGYEGDRGSDGDALELNTTPISDALNPDDNFFNSTIGIAGSRFTDKGPDYNNQLGFDADMVNADGVLQNGDIDADIHLTTGGETYFPGVVTFATELFAPDIDPVKSVTDVNGGEAHPGDVLEYSVELENTGGDAADELVLTDAIPANASYEPGTLNIAAPGPAAQQTDAPGDDQAEYDAANDSVRFRLGTGASASDGGSLAAGDSTTVTFRVRIDASLPEGRVVSNRASADFIGGRTDIPFRNVPSNETETTVTAPPFAELAIAKQVNAPTVASGELVTYTLVATNGGPDDATGVTVQDDLSPGLELVSATPSAGSCSQADPVVCNVGDVSAGGAAQVAIVARATAQAGQTLNNHAAVSGDQTDPEPGNNQADAPGVTVLAPPPTPPAAPDLVVTKEASTASPVENRPLTYTIAIENRGPGQATGVKLTDTHAASAEIQSLSASQGTCAQGVPIVCELGTLAPGARATVTVVLIPRERGALANTASVTSVESEAPATVVNNQGAANVQVRAARTRVSVSKRAARRSARPGDRIAYRIVVRNRGANPARNLRVCDRLPSGLAFRSARGARFRDGRACWRIATLARGRSRSFRVVAAATNVSSARRAVNRARVTGSNIPRARDGAGVRLLPAADRGGGVTG